MRHDTPHDQRDRALDLVDLERYPINTLDHGAGAAFLADCRHSIDTFGWCNLDGFIRADALEQLNREAVELLPTASDLEITRTIYQSAADGSHPEGDPRGSPFCVLRSFPRRRFHEMSTDPGVDTME
ncbi:MAG: hypothetical protein AAF460_13075 [Pseudomonadota bacterium]